MGTVPWKGGYEVWHEPPRIRTKLADGTRLRVSYHHAITIHDGQVMICPSEPKTVELLRDEAKRMHAAWGAKAYFMSHDEIRVLNWDEACTRRKLDAGAILADNAKTCVAILREVAPKAAIYVWSDMFDPHHNAKKDYYLVRGRGSTARGSRRASRGSCIRRGSAGMRISRRSRRSWTSIGAESLNPRRRPSSIDGRSGVVVWETG
jgi:hypothetical protein